MSRRNRRKGASSRRYYLVGVAFAAVAIAIYALASSPPGGRASAGSEPVILYVDQGNGAVNGSNFRTMLSTATSHGFNTIFFQVYRSGTLLFSNGSLGRFVESAHSQGLEIFFALYFTNSTQTIPLSIFSDGEDGISLDMSALPVGAQITLFDYLSSNYPGRTAITTTDPTLPLTPDLLVLETYAPGDQQYIHHGMVAGVEVAATSSRQDYDQQVGYALRNSDGVMVFDYHGLVKAGY
ncbi:MAG: hypothetical protein JRN23_02585 [Nitrososphaerota archaeon]|nr:hypothetical protein [Nitrososphaerota archaeon]